MTDWFTGVISVAVLVLAFMLGWIASASTISVECRRLGAFYVAEKVFECKFKEKNT